MEKSKVKPVSATLAKLVESIDKQSEERAKAKWQQLFAALKKIETEIGVPYEVIEEAAEQLGNVHNSRPPKQLVEHEKKDIIKTVISGCPF